jgi:N6-L-threonylcarbamoyladenine synthase
MLVLGLETSCDETAAALVDDGRTIHANEVLSQHDAHRAFGGVVPEIAARAHLEHLQRLVRKAMGDAQVGWGDLSAIAATSGPGLIGGLMVGVVAAKAICAARALPFIAVNHLEAHALTARLTHGIAFPYLLLLASGGHTQLLLVQDVGQYCRLGVTMDDAAGEAFDKVAKMLNLGFPGGPALSRAAITGDPKRFAFPMPLAGRPGCDFSFSGLKTAARQMIEGLGPNPSDTDRADVAASFQAVMTRIVADRVRRAMDMGRGIHPGLSHFVVAGGVAANGLIRETLQATCVDNGFTLAAPPPHLCTDNAAMVAWTGIERLQRGLTDNLDFAPRPRWPLAA